MTKKVAVLLDGGYVTYEYNWLNKKPPTADDIEHIAKCCFKKDEELFRFYYYDCRPFEGAAFNPALDSRVDFASNPIFKARESFYNNLAVKDYFAFRAGQLKFRGWKVRPRAISDHFKKGAPLDKDALVPNFQQKGVDIKIGLDIAWLATKNIVDRIILFTGDTDFLPAMKFARTEGVQVIIAAFRDNLRSEMKDNADEFRIITL